MMSKPISTHIHPWRMDLFHVPSYIFNPLLLAYLVNLPVPLGGYPSLKMQPWEQKILLHDVKSGTRHLPARG